jgi:hypothetical protein
MRRPSITADRSIFLGRRQIIPPSNCPPFGRKLIGSHGDPEPENPIYLRWEEKPYKEEDEPNLHVESKERTVHSWQVPSHPKLAIIRTQCWKGEVPAGRLPQLESIKSRPTSNLFLAVVFALAVCFRGS